MNWTVFDFVVFGAMLLTVAIIVALTIRTSTNTAYRSAVGVAVAAAFLLVWINGAVGIIGSEDNDANMMFFGVLAVGAIGGLIARFQPEGLARSMSATALAQAMVGVIALVANLGSAGQSWPWDVIVLTGFFTALWIASAWLFRVAARRQHAARYGGPRLLD